MWGRAGVPPPPSTWSRVGLTYVLSYHCLGCVTLPHGPGPIPVCLSARGGAWQIILNYLAGSRHESIFLGRTKGQKREGGRRRALLRVLVRTCPPTLVPSWPRLPSPRNGASVSLPRVCLQYGDVLAAELFIRHVLTVRILHTFMAHG